MLAWNSAAYLEANSIFKSLAASDVPLLKEAKGGSAGRPPYPQELDAVSLPRKLMGQH